PIRGHGVRRFHGANDARLFVRAIVAHDADALHREEHGEHLPEGVVEAGGADLVADDLVRLAEYLEPRLRYLAQTADREAGARERVPPEDVTWHVERRARF